MRFQARHSRLRQHGWCLTGIKARQVSIGLDQRLVRGQLGQRADCGECTLGQPGMRNRARQQQRIVRGRREATCKSIAIQVGTNAGDCQPTHQASEQRRRRTSLLHWPDSQPLHERIGIGAASGARVELLDNQLGCASHTQRIILRRALALAGAAAVVRHSCPDLEFAACNVY
jgi:hypothetical protein